MTKKTLDSDLLRLLEKDARASISVLAARLNVSRSTIRSRMEKLETDGTIQGYTIQYADDYAKSRVRAHVMLTTTTSNTINVERSLRELSGIRALHTLAGDYDLLAQVEADNTTILDSTLDAIRSTEGVNQTHTVILLATRFRR